MLPVFSLSHKLVLKSAVNEPESRCDSEVSDLSVTQESDSLHIHPAFSD